jgi:aspartate/methionine/tyrosine aminotransferase
VLDEVGKARFAEFVAARDRPHVRLPPPPYPYDRVAAWASWPRRCPGGMVDCSIGTPCDPPPPRVIEALSSSGSERGYPASAGSPALRRAAAVAERRFGCRSVPGSVAACVGTKELVASVPHSSPAPPRARHRAVPRGVLPDLRHGGRAGRLPGRAGAAAPGRSGGLDLEAIAETDAGRALVLWSNSPSNPTGGPGRPGAEAAWGRAHGVPVFSDECYAEFTWDGPPRSVLQHGFDGVVAVHSLSKRSNLAGVRVGFYAGDPELVEFLRAVRQHAGLMVPGPAQAAGGWPWPTTTTSRPAGRYRERLEFLADVLGTPAARSSSPRAASTCGCRCPPGPLERRLGHGRGPGRDGGLLVSPGDLYGEEGPASSGWPWSSPWSGWSWWRTAWLAAG